MELINITFLKSISYKAGLKLSDNIVEEIYVKNVYVLPTFIIVTLLTFYLIIPKEDIGINGGRGPASVEEKSNSCFAMVKNIFKRKKYEFNYVRYQLRRDSYLHRLESKQIILTDLPMPKNLEEMFALIEATSERADYKFMKELPQVSKRKLKKMNKLFLNTLDKKKLTKYDLQNLVMGIFKIIDPKGLRKSYERFSKEVIRQQEAFATLVRLAENDEMLHEGTIKFVLQELSRSFTGRIAIALSYLQPILYGVPPFFPKFGTVIFDELGPRSQKFFYYYSKGKRYYNAGLISLLSGYIIYESFFVPREEHLIRYARTSKGYEDILNEFDEGKISKKEAAAKIQEKLDAPQVSVFGEVEQSLSEADEILIETYTLKIDEFEKALDNPKYAHKRERIIKKIDELKFQRDELLKRREND